jgi:NAD(P)-dependent dehydrogenase (short-subunit alcohol dehydrogenase family)
MAERELAERVFLVTGAGGDIGRALVSELCTRGARVAASDVLDQAAGEALFQAPAADSGAVDAPGVSYFQADVRSPEDVDSLLAAVIERYGRIDGLVAAAGVAHWATALEQTYDQWRHVLDVNLEGAYLAAQAVSRELVRAGRPGAIAFVGSWIGSAAARGLLPYCVSKAGLDMLAQCLALELAPHGIRVNVVAPGVVDAGVSAQIFREIPARRKEMEAVIPLGSLGRPEQVADAVAYLLSDAAGYITGTTLVVDGGIRLAHAGG